MPNADMPTVESFPEWLRAALACALVISGAVLLAWALPEEWAHSCLAAGSFGCAIVAAGGARRLFRLRTGGLPLRQRRLESALALCPDESPGLEVAVRGELSGDPTLVAPISRRPCGYFRLEVLRASSSDEPELLAVEEEAADRLVLRDEGGEVGFVGSAAMLARGAPLAEVRLLVRPSAATEVLPSEVASRLEALVREADSAAPGGDARIYWAVERSLPNGIEAGVRGRLERKEGVPVLALDGARIDWSPATSPAARPTEVILFATGAIWLATGLLLLTVA